APGAAALDADRWSRVLAVGFATGELHRDIGPVGGVDEAQPAVVHPQLVELPSRRAIALFALRTLECPVRARALLRGSEMHDRLLQWQHRHVQAATQERPDTDREFKPLRARHPGFVPGPVGMGQPQTIGAYDGGAAQADVEIAIDMECPAGI